jgi:hypothetical protein
MKYALRAVAWIIALAVALPLIPVVMSLCAGIYFVAVASDRGERGAQLSLVAGVFSVVVSAAGIALTYLLVRLGIGLFGGR